MNIAAIGSTAMAPRVVHLRPDIRNSPPTISVKTGIESM
jgi:hypothetical protein